jgi:N-methylhydantoinase A
MTPPSSPSPAPLPSLSLAADIGGTFTDVVLAGPTGELWSAKLLTTHDDPIEGLLAGTRAVLDQAGAVPGAVGRVVHGTTLATNVILEGKGAPVAFVTTQGFGSMLELGRQARIQEERYDLLWSATPPPVPPERTFEVPERTGPAGEVVRPLDEAAVAEVVAAIAGQDVAAVAVCLLHSYANPDHERRVAELCRQGLPDDVLVICSTDILVEMREHDRAVTTVMSATVAPVMSAYLRRLGQRLADLGIPAPLHVMSSSGEVLSAELAARQAIATVESGPAAGVMAAQQIGLALGRPDVLSLDMGGTTAKAAIVRDGRPHIAQTFNVGGSTSAGGRLGGGGLTIKIPAIDLAEVGAGGGSIAWVDQGGALRVGPRSAGSTPGPACYGLGGTDATVTDANLVLGYLAPDGFAGGTMALDPARAHDALARHVAEPLGVAVEQAAAAVHELANAAMAGAIAVVTVQRGIDPRDFALVALGGAGPVHAARLAERFDVATVVVPAAAGVGSAVGLLESDLGYERSATVMAPTRSLDAAALTAQLDDLAREAATELGGTPGEAGSRVERRADVRFRGQSHEVTLPLPAGPLGAGDLAELEATFHRFQLDTYGIHLEDPTELVAVRVRVVIEAARSRGLGSTPAPPAGAPAPAGVRRIHLTEAGGFVEVPLHRREELLPGHVVTGPAVVAAAETTAIVPPGWTGTVDPRHHLVLERTPEVAP